MIKGRKHSGEVNDKLAYLNREEKILRLEKSLELRNLFFDKCIVGILIIILGVVLNFLSKNISELYRRNINQQESYEKDKYKSLLELNECYQKFGIEIGLHQYKEVGDIYKRTITLLGSDIVYLSDSDWTKLYFYASIYQNLSISLLVPNKEPPADEQIFLNDVDSDWANIIRYELSVDYNTYRENIIMQFINYIRGNSETRSAPEESIKYDFSSFSNFYIVSKQNKLFDLEYNNWENNRSGVK